VDRRRRSGSDCAGTTCKTIQGAVDHAGAGDTINVHPGVYIQALSVSKSLAINGAPGVIVSALSGSVPLTVTGGTVTLSNLNVLSAGRTRSSSARPRRPPSPSTRRSSSEAGAAPRRSTPFRRAPSPAAR